MKKYFLLILVLILIPFHIYSQVDSSITFSEIMFSPQSGNNEFIELYNLSSVDTIDLNGFKIKYYTSSPDSIKETNEGTKLLPNQYAVIFEGDYDFENGIYKSLIPDDALVLKIADNAFGSSGMSNTTSRDLYLINPQNDTIEVIIYSANNSTGYSDEKIILSKDNSQSNWGNSTNLNGTPGYTNSITPVIFDLAIASLIISPSNPIENDNVNIIATIKNIGKNSAENFSVQFYNDINFDSLGSQNELLNKFDILSLSSNDSLELNSIISNASANQYQIIVEIIFPADENLVNNKKIINFTVSTPSANYNDVIINEIMYAPSTGEPEWVELYNKTNSSINLRKWKIGDNSTSTTIIDVDKFIPANSYIVITRDSSILNYYNIPSEIIKVNLPSLNNTGDAVVIRDSVGFIVDSVFYDPNWGGNTGGKSLERKFADTSSLNPFNWFSSESIYKATPGRINSITPKNNDLLVSRIIFNPATPIKGDNVSISTLIKNVGKNSAQFILNLFEDTNLDSIPDNLISTSENLFLSQNDSMNYNFNYVIENLQSQKGFYVKVIYEQDEDTTNNIFYSKISPSYPPSTIVINEIMFTPLGGEPEWIELYNTSNDTINLKSWTINDVVTTPAYAKINNEILFSPQSFLVLTKDSSIINYHRIIPSKIVKVNLPILNNDIDGVVLKDSVGAVIDSVLYSSDWGGTNGYSLERKDISIESNLMNNWTSSNDIEFSTPGRINSATTKNYDLTISQINSVPKYPAFNENISLSAVVKNNGINSANNFAITFYFDSDSNQVIDTELETINGLSINSGDSIVATTNKKIQNLLNKTLVSVRINYSEDEDTLNNYYETYIEPGIQSKAIVINEIMFNPNDNESEWIELMNISNEVMNLKNWSISDFLSTPTKSFLSTTDYFVEPDEIIVVAKDSSIKNIYPDFNSKIIIAKFGTLGNTEDGVFIYDFRNGIIDSVIYKSTWQNKKGFSIERISIAAPSNDSTNWIISLDNFHATPGKQNSVLDIISYNKNDVVINEIMFDPDIDNTEYIELYNPTNDTINLGGWRFKESSKEYRFLDTSFYLLPHNYFLIAADSILLEKYNYLNNEKNKSILNVSDFGLSISGELILLKDAKGNVIDSVLYSDKWHNRNFNNTKNKSLERINPLLSSNAPSNWNTSVDAVGGTPAKQNSIFTENQNRESKISISPNPFSPDNDGFEDYTIINYNLVNTTSQIRIRIYDNKGRLVRTLANNQASGSNGSIIFDGLDDDGNTLRMGIYIVLLEALNQNSSEVEQIKSVVVVARKLN